MSSVAVTSRSFSKNCALRNELLQRYPNVNFNESGETLKGCALIKFLQGYEKIIVGLEKLSAEVLTELPRLKVISRFGVGLDTLDLDEIKKRGIKLAYTAGANKRAVSELVLALAINMLRHLPTLNTEVKADIWRQIKGRELSGKKFGIVGLGAIGKDLVSLLKVFGCEILAFDSLDHYSFCTDNNISQVDLSTLLTQADLISLHLPLNYHTANILNSKMLNLLKPSAILINTARGGLVDELALKDFLQRHASAAAAFDVFAVEPMTDKALLNLPNFFATPHVGGSTEEAILKMGYAAISGLETAILL